MQPDVSFVIAAHNAEATIARAIDSAFRQRGVSVEVIVVDDCSTDRTAEVARGFSKGDVRVIQLESNRGPGGARNAGIDAASGRWIAILDSDDSVYPERMHRMIRRAETMGAQIVVDNLDVVQEASDTRETMFPPSLLERRPEMSLADFIGANIMFENTFSFGYMKPAFETQFVRRLGLRYNEALRIGEDYTLLATALARGGRCAIEPAVGYSYHIRSGSISRVLELHHVEAMLAADEVFLRDHPLGSEAGAAQARRTRSLQEAASFLSLIRHLKDRAPLKAAGAALRDPIALRHLKMPAAARLRRLARAFQSRDASVGAG